MYAYIYIYIHSGAGRLAPVAREVQLLTRLAQLERLVI